LIGHLVFALPDFRHPFAHRLWERGQINREYHRYLRTALPGLSTTRQAVFGFHRWASALGEITQNPQTRQRQSGLARPFQFVQIDNPEINFEQARRAFVEAWSGPARA